MKLFKTDEHGHFVPTEGIVYKGQVVECWLPDHCGPHIPYDPRKLPVIMINTVIERDIIHQWSSTGCVNTWYSPEI